MQRGHGGEGMGRLETSEERWEKMNKRMNLGCVCRWLGGEERKTRGRREGGLVC